MIRIRTLTAAVALSMGSLAPFAVQSAYAKQPVVTKTSSTTSTQLTIEGTDLGSGRASVLLGSFGPLAVVAQTATELVVALPSGLTAGNYVLSVQIGNGVGNSDESVVTIGMSGTAGTSGPAGPRGAEGPAGPAGTMGAVGPAGPVGPMGPAGAVDLRVRPAITVTVLRSPSLPPAISPAALIRLWSGWRSTRRNSRCALRLGCGLPAGRRRRDVPRHATLPRFGSLSVVEARQAAGDDVTACDEALEALAHRCQGHADFLGDLEIESLTVLFQTLEDFHHGSHLFRRCLPGLRAGQTIQPPTTCEEWEPRQYAP